MSNRRAGVYDPGAEFGRHSEAEIVMTWANELREILRADGHYVCRTRIDGRDEAPVGQRAKIAKDFRCEIMISLHCNAFDGRAQGTETFYRGPENMLRARLLNEAVSRGLGTLSRGVKTEGQSQHSSLAVMSFQPCFLLELGFIDNASDLASLINPALRRATCDLLAKVITLKA